MSHIIKAASVLLARGSGPAELFIVRRAEGLRFFGGFMAFPGGKVHAADHELLSAPAESLQDRYVTAARELFEETGVLLARKPDGSYPPSGSVLNYLRRKMATEDLPFAEVLTRLDLSLNSDDFVLLGNITTPPFVPTRFDTAFFEARIYGKANWWAENGRRRTLRWSDGRGGNGSCPRPRLRFCRQFAASRSRPSRIILRLCWGIGLTTIFRQSISLPACR